MGIRENIPILPFKKMDCLFDEGIVNKEDADNWQ